MADVAPPQEWVPTFNPWLIAVSVMLATVMEVLDTSVANVALPHIAGNLSATTEEATWVLTSYLISNAIILPATSWIGKYIGRKRFLIICIIIFTGASALCGAAPNLTVLIIARILQGMGGGASAADRSISIARELSAGETRRGDGHLRHGNRRRPDNRPNVRWLDHR